MLEFPKYLMKDEKETALNYYLRLRAADPYIMWKFYAGFAVGVIVGLFVVGLLL